MWSVIAIISVIMKVKGNDWNIFLYKKSITFLIYNADVSDVPHMAESQTYFIGKKLHNEFS